MRAAALFMLGLVACPSEVHIVDDDGTPQAGGAGGDGTTVDTGGVDGTGGSGGSGGLGGLGGEGGSIVEPAPVPGCEVLREAKDRVDVAGGYDGFLVPVSPTDLGVIYQADEPGLWSTASRVLVDAYAAWPPTVTEPIVHAAYPPDILTRDTRLGGDYTVNLSGGWGWIVGSVLVEGTLMATDTHPSTFPILEPSPGTGVYWHEDGVLSYFPSLDAEVPTAEIPLPFQLPNYVRTYGVNDTGDLILIGDGSFFHVHDGMLVQGAPVPAVEGWQWGILPRTGGFWFGVPTPVMELYAVDNEGTVSGAYRPLGDREFTYRGDMAPWRDGVALASSGQESGGFTVAVTDGEHTTSLRLSGDETNFCQNGISVLASPSGDSVYVGYVRCLMADISFTVRRFDCAAE